MTERQHSLEAVSKQTHGFDRALLELLVCPLTKEPLIYDQEKQELISKSAKLAYPIRNGIAVMLIDEARQLEDN